MNETIRPADSTPLPCCLTIAGSDSGGNAGVQADLRAFHAFGIHGCTVFTALTAQNPFGVSAIHAVPPEFIAAQLSAVLGVYNIRALKTGMLAEPGIIEIIAERLAAHPEIAKVIDPVMIATSGAKLISDDAISTLKKRLLPLAKIITPNLPEAVTLCGKKADPTDMARMLHDEYGCAVLVKGGHGNDSEAMDFLCTENGEILAFSSRRIEDPISTHGTGCTMAASIAAGLALGHTIEEAVRSAKNFVGDAIASSFYVGENCGVLGFASARQ